jgi:hypothetical protein
MSSAAPQGRRVRLPGCEKSRSARAACLSLEEQQFARRSHGRWFAGFSRRCKTRSPRPKATPGRGDWAWDRVPFGGGAVPPTWGPPWSLPWSRADRSTERSTGAHLARTNAAHNTQTPEDSGGGGPPFLFRETNGASPPPEVHGGRIWPAQLTNARKPPPPQLPPIRRRRRPAPRPENITNGASPPLQRRAESGRLFTRPHTKH